MKNEFGNTNSKDILLQAPAEVIDLLARMVYHFGLKLNLDEKELIQYVKSVEDRDMGELWANMKTVDIQAERRNTEEARQQLQAERRNTEEARSLLAERDKIIAEKDLENENLRKEIERLTQLLEK